MAFWNFSPSRGVHLHDVHVLDNEVLSSSSLNPVNVADFSVARFCQDFIADFSWYNQYRIAKSPFEDPWFGGPPLS